MLILTILKIIGIIILIIIGILLLIAIYCLFSPVSYNLSSDFDRKNYIFRVHDVLRFISITLKYTQSKFSYRISLFFGIKSIIGPTKKDKNKKTKNKKNKEKLRNNDKNSSNKIKQNYKEIVFGEKYRKTINLIIKELFKTLNRLKPRVFRADINYSLGEPDKTGMLTGGLSLLSFIYNKKNKVYPDFESNYPYISGKIKIKGQVKLIWFVVLFFKLFSKSSVRSLLQKLR